jgi:hypothetical protein
VSGGQSNYEADGTLLIAYSARAVMVSDGLTPGLAGMTETSIMYGLRYLKT